MKFYTVLFLGFFVLAQALMVNAQRVVIPLNGQWAVEEGIQPEAIPTVYNHTVPVPGLTHQSTPAFPDVDKYETRDYVLTMIKNGVLPSTERCDSLGRTPQKRNYFWYQKSFTTPARKNVATLVINKAQFGTAVWLNGIKIGEHIGCFTSGRFDISKAIRWKGENNLVIRIGAHPGVMPKWAPWGNDGEKAVWTPGIYDEVSVLTADNPSIESIQVAPRIGGPEIVVQTKLKNQGPACETELVQHIKTWKGQQSVDQPVRLKVSLSAGEEKIITQSIPVPNATLWSPENPFLYTLQTTTSGDDCVTRFGMREFRFDTPTRRAYLNGKVYFMRGTNISLHRFFGDPLCQEQPWDERWLRKLLVDIPHRMCWNSMRICIGPTPQKWLDIADEAGLLLQWEFPIWSDRDPWYYKSYSEGEIISQLKEFMQDNWNHPSVAIWDASNETAWSFLGDKAIPAVRGLDLSNRPWENSFNPPQGADDPREDHPYLFINHWYEKLSGVKRELFKMQDLEGMAGGSTYRSGLRDANGHAWIINEYDWLWLHRDGTPTALTGCVFKNLGLMSPEVTAQKRFEESAYFLGGLTEFWRAYRNYAAVMYLAYLDGDLPNCFTCDNFSDVQKLEIEPHFVDYMSEAFKPLGVYINFWQPKLSAGNQRKYNVMLVNDENQFANGKLELSWVTEDGSKEIPAATRNYEVAPLGQTTYEFELAAPAVPGFYILKGKASWEGKPWSPTIVRRKVQIIVPYKTISH